MILFLLKLSMFTGVAVAAGGVPLPGLAYGKVSIKAPGYGQNLKNALRRNMPMEMFLPELTTQIPDRDVVNELPDAEEQILPPVPEDSIDRLDEDYVKILEELENRKRTWSASHRDLQWHFVARAVTEFELDQKQRVALLRAVTINPLYNRLSPTLAIEPLILQAWAFARDEFFAQLRREIAGETD